jgi:hypothetical protein
VVFGSDFILRQKIKPLGFILRQKIKPLGFICLAAYNL